jgi:hypothetical protein
LSRELKKFSAKIYGEVIRDVIGDSLHPGGLDLTARVAEVAKISKDCKVLDIACGRGASVRFIAKNFECNVIGIDLSAKLIQILKGGIAKESFLERTEFAIGDAELVPCINSCFDVVICESALSLFPDKRKVLSEVHRVLKSGGRIVATNIVLKRDIPAELKRKLTFALCIAGAETLERFYELFEWAGFINIHTEDHSEKLIALGLKLLLSDSLTEASTVNVTDQPVLRKLFNEDVLGYALMVANKP